ncbi:MAG TPA: MarR family transcriptional regulator [Alphaproteobacteria bacterium]
MPARQRKRPTLRRRQKLSIASYSLPSDEAVRAMEREMFAGRFVDEYLSALLARASIAVSREFNNDVDRRGMPIPQWRILASLWDNPGLSLSDLAELTVLKQPTLTRLVQRLQKRGLVRKEIDPHDRRLLRLSLTARGRNEVKDLIRIARERQKRVLHGLDADGLIAVLRHLIAFCAAKRRGGLG